MSYYYDYNEEREGRKVNDTSAFTVYDIYTKKKTKLTPTDHWRTSFYTTPAHLVFSQDGGMIAAIKDTYITVWDVLAGKLIYRKHFYDSFEPNKRLIDYASAKFTPDNKILVTKVLKKTLKKDPLNLDKIDKEQAFFDFWDITNWDRRSVEVKALKVGNDWTHTTVSPDLKTLLFLEKGKFVFMDIASENRTKTFNIPTQQGENIRLVRLSPDAKILAVAIETTSNLGAIESKIALFDLLTGEKLKTLIGLKRGGSIEFSPDGKRLISINKSAIHIWDVSTGSEIISIDKVGYPNDFFINHNNMMLAYRDSENTIKIKNIGCKLIHSFFSKNEFETSAEFKMRVQNGKPIQWSANLDTYDADHGVFKAKIFETNSDFLIKMDKDKAIDIKKNGTPLHIKGLLKFHDTEILKLVGAYVINPLTTERFEVIPAKK